MFQEQTSATTEEAEQQTVSQGYSYANHVLSDALADHNDKELYEMLQNFRDPNETDPQYKPDINACTIYPSGKRSPYPHLMIAIRFSNLRGVRELIALGVKTDVRSNDNEGLPAIFLACEKGDPDVVQALLAANPSLTKVTWCGGSLFMHAMTTIPSYRIIKDMLKGTPEQYEHFCLMRDWYHKKITLADLKKKNAVPTQMRFLGMPDICDILLNYGSKITDHNGRGLTIWHIYNDLLSCYKHFFSYENGGRKGFKFRPETVTKDSFVVECDLENRESTETIRIELTVDVRVMRSLVQQRLESSQKQDSLNEIEKKVVALSEEHKNTQEQLQEHEEHLKKQTQQIQWLVRETLTIQKQLESMDAKFAESQQYFECWLSSLTAETRDAVAGTQERNIWQARKSYIAANPLAKEFCIHLALALRYWVARAEVGIDRKTGVIEQGVQAGLGFLGESVSFIPCAKLLFTGVSKIVQKVGDWKHEKAQEMTRKLFVLQKSSHEICDRTALVVTEQALRYQFFVNVGSTKSEQSKYLEMSKKHAENISTVLIYAMGGEYLAEALEKANCPVEESFAQLLVNCDIFQKYAKEHMKNIETVTARTMTPGYHGTVTTNASGTSNSNISAAPNQHGVYYVQQSSSTNTQQGHVFPTPSAPAWEPPSLTLTGAPAPQGAIVATSSGYPVQQLGGYGLANAQNANATSGSVAASTAAGINPAQTQPGNKKDKKDKKEKCTIM